MRIKVLNWNGDSYDAGDLKSFPDFDGKFNLYMESLANSIGRSGCVDFFLDDGRQLHMVRIPENSESGAEEHH